MTRGLRAWLLAAVAAFASLLALLVEGERILAQLELGTVDSRFVIRGERPTPRDVVVVAIDEETFTTLRERFPFSRRTFARALERIAADRPRAIVYDVQFTEPSDDLEADNALVLASRRARNVVFSTTEVDAEGNTNVFGGPEGQAAARATIGNGLLPQDPGGVLRRVPAEVNGIPSLAVATVRLLGRRVDTSALGRDGAWIDLQGPPGRVRRVSFGDVVAGRLPRGTFRDRIPVIGAVAPSLHDVHRSAWPGELMPGPEIHANAISTLLRGVPLRSSAGWVDVLLAVALSVLGPLAGTRLRPLAGIALALAAAAAYLVAAQLAFEAGRVLPVAAPLLGLGVGVVGTLGVHYLTAAVERAQARDLFARFVPDAVVSQVLAQADMEDPRLGGVELEATVMFSDLRGFTSFAEQRPPEQVIEALNRYLTLMSDAILDHGGTLVAYMGDGIMAVFGAPVPSEDHASRGLAAAREMLRRLDEFNEWLRGEAWGNGFKMGIGLNTGRVMSGNVGSMRRLEYTAIGDTTNTAARLEAMTKETPHQLFVAQSTYAALPSPPEDLEFVDELEVRGRRARIPVWTLRSAAADDLSAFAAAGPAA